MKKLTLFKGKAMVCLILMFLALAQGCKKDLLQPNKNDLQNGLSIVEAKQYFDANLKQLAKSKKLMGTGSGVQDTKILTLDDVRNNKQPIWEKAHQMMISNGTSVKIPIDFNQALAVVGTKKDVLPMSSLNYLLMYRDSLKEIHAEWVFLQPDSLWLYGSRDTYHGDVYVSEWNGKPIKKLSFPRHTSANKFSKAPGGSHGKLMSVAEEPILVPGGNISICIRYRTGVCTCTSGPCDWMTCNVCGVTSCGKNLTVWVIDDKFPDGPDKPPTTGSGGESPSPGNGIGGGGSPNPNDYVPLNCNPDPNYVDPHIINADGSMSVPACSDIPIPQCENCPTSGPAQPTTLTKSEFLTLALAIQPYETNLRNFINDPANELVVENMFSYLDDNGGNTQENIGFLRWAISYILNNGNSQYITSLLKGVYENPADLDAESTSTNFNFDNINSDLAFTSNGINIYGNGPSAPDYPSTHPVSEAVAAYNPWIYLAFSNSNNTSIRHFHKQVRGLAGSDGWGKAIGAIGEGLAASRITSWPTSPGFQYRVGYMVGTTHLDGLQWGFLFKTSTGTGWGLNVVNSDLDGNEVITKMEKPDGPEVMGQKIARISYEIKTISPYNNPAYLWASFSEGIKQAEHRANSSGISASVLLFDTDSFIKLKNSTYGPQLLNRLAIMFSRKNGDGEQKIYLRLEKNLYANARSSYFALMDRIKNIQE